MVQVNSKFQSERISYEEFREWLLAHPDATTVTRWLLAEPCHVSLSNDLETPTFYQTLAGVTHCECSFMYGRCFLLLGMCHEYVCKSLF